MANASVEKLKALGIRHGEKAVVGLTGTLFVVFAALAFIHPTLEMKPDELQKQAEGAQSNINAKQDPNDILHKLEVANIKNPDFAKMIANQRSNALNPADFRVKMGWVTPEPGAGLIRDQPELIAPTELAAFPGRGGILMYALNAEGEKIPDNGPDAKGANRANRRRPGGMGGMGDMAGMMGGGSPREETAEAKRRRLLEDEKRKKAFAGSVDPAKEKEKAKTEEAPAEPQGQFKEETKGKRWAVITGVINNEQMKKNWFQALKVQALAYPNYKRIDAERQSQQADGAWTEWAAVDTSKNYAILDNLPEIDTEYVPEPMRPGSLVDSLPYLKAGYWTGVHVARLVPAEARETPKAEPAGPMGGMAGMGGMMRPGGPSEGGGMSTMGRPGMAMPKGMGGMGAMGMAGEGGGMGTRGGASDSGGNAEEAAFTHVEEGELMLRSIDFTVDPDMTYRFRVRIVVVNPNKDHTDVNPGVDVDSKELLGPWSEPTGPVTVPADVASYAAGPKPTARREDLVEFQVIRWDPGTGQTVVRNHTAGPGEIVGEYGSVPMPSSEGVGVKSANIDFNSRAIVLDTIGGKERLPDIGVERNPFDIPAIAMVVQPDGSIAIRNQARDKSNEVRKDMEANYKQAIKDSGTKREGALGGSRMPEGGNMPGMPTGGARKKKGRR